MLEYTSSYLKSGLERWKSRGPLGWTSQSRQTRFELLADRKPDCFVYPTGDGYFIGMTVGFPLRLLAVSSMLLTHKSVFSTIHDMPLHEAQVGESSETVDNVDEDVYQTENGTTVRLETLDQLRWNYAFGMAMDALRFLICHECAHIFRGHLYHRGIVSGLSFFDESDVTIPDQSLSFSTPTAGGEVRVETIERFYELDADAWASSILVREQGGRHDAGSDAALATRRRLNRALMAIAMLFMIQRPVGTLASYDNQRYPHPRTRFQCVVTWALTALAKELGLEDDQHGKQQVALYMADALEAIEVLYQILPSEYKEEFLSQPDAFSQDMDKNLTTYYRLTALLFDEANTLLPAE